MCQSPIAGSMADGKAVDKEAVDLITEIQGKLGNLLGLMYSCTGAIQVILHVINITSKRFLFTLLSYIVLYWSLFCSVMLQRRLCEARKHFPGHQHLWETQQPWQKRLSRPRIASTPCC